MSDWSKIARFETVMFMNAIVGLYTRAMPVRAKRMSNGKIYDPNAPFVESLISASFVPEEEDYASVKSAIRKVTRVMKEYENETTSITEIEYMVRLRKKMEELSSILHISTSYPKSATERAKSLLKKKGR
jgi:hypothetical protein